MGCFRFVFRLFDDHWRRGRSGEEHVLGLPAESEGANPGESGSESAEGLEPKQEDS